jgi:hypothetical protein
MVAPGECSSLWLRGSFHLAAGAVVQGAAGRCRAGRNPTASAAGLSPEMGSNDGLSSSNAQASASCHTTRTGVRSDPHLPTRLPQSQLTIRHGEEVDAPAALVAPDLVSGVRELAPPSSGNPPTTGSAGSCTRRPWPPRTVAVGQFTWPRGPSDVPCAVVGAVLHEDVGRCPQHTHQPVAISILPGTAQRKRGPPEGNPRGSSFLAKRSSTTRRSACPPCRLPGAREPSRNRHTPPPAG